MMNKRNIATSPCDCALHVPCNKEYNGMTQLEPYILKKEENYEIENSITDTCRVSSFHVITKLLDIENCGET